MSYSFVTSKLKNSRKASINCEILLSIMDWMGARDSGRFNGMGFSQELKWIVEGAPSKSVQISLQSTLAIL